MTVVIIAAMSVCGLFIVGGLYLIGAGMWESHVERAEDARRAARKDPTNIRLVPKGEIHP